MLNQTKPDPVRSPLLDKAQAQGIRHGYFTRTGGVSSGIYRGLNIGTGSNDDQALVAENRGRVAAWMGVPTVSLVGPALYERLSYSILSNAGLGDLCARSVEDYVRTAVALADDRARLAELRATLRDRLRASPLGQTRQFAADFYEMIARRVEGGRA